MSQSKKIKIRHFNNGAIRDTADGKLEYFGFRHPLCEQSFAKYMLDHQQLPDGSMRDSNNWWKGWNQIISLQSMVRHLEDLQALHSGLVVLEIRSKRGVEKVYYDLSKNIPYTPKKGELVKIITKEEALNAIRFNTQAYLLDYLKQ
jgi:hypothetical protein